MNTVPFAVLLRRERWLVLGGLLGIVAIAWLYMAQMAAMQSTALNMPAQWTAGYFAMMLGMWVVMMVAMMLPSVLHVVLLFARVATASGPASRPVLRSYLFAGGYLLSWLVFSLAATVLQWVLDQFAALSMDMAAISPGLSAGILLVAGIYQWTPAKNACLEHCRGPVDYLGRHWRKGLGGALRMGFSHGLYCVGCCWVLMALLFVGGVMNLLVIAAITLFVLLEKLAPFGAFAGRLSGAGLVLAGLLLLIR